MPSNRKGANLPINSTVAFVIAIMAAVVFLAVVLPLLTGLEGSGGCTGAFRSVAAVMADMTGVNMCS